MTNPDMKKALEWAETRAYGNYILGEETEAAVRVIQSLPAQWVDAKKVQAMIDSYKHARDSNAEGTEGWVINHLMVSNLESLLTPSLPTLADMPPEERKACLWMQAKIHHSEDLEGVIFSLTDYRVKVMFRDGTFVTQDHDEVTPLPNLPKLEWPSLSVSDESEAVSVETEESEGLPSPEDVPAGEPWIVECDDYEWVGTRDSGGRENWPWVLARLDGVNCRVARDSEITLVSRLVPEVSRG